MVRYVTGDEVYVLRMYGDETEPVPGVVCAVFWQGVWRALPSPSSPVVPVSIDYNVLLRSSGNIVGVSETWLSPRNIVIDEVPDTPWD